MTTLGPSLTVTGDITSNEDITVHGTVKGTLTMQQGALVIAPAGKAEANVEGSTITVHGTVSGDLTATTRLDSSTDWRVRAATTTSFSTGSPWLGIAVTRVVRSWSDTLAISTVCSATPALVPVAVPPAQYQVEPGAAASGATGISAEAETVDTSTGWSSSCRCTATAATMSSGMRASTGQRRVRTASGAARRALTPAHLRPAAPPGRGPPRCGSGCGTGR